MGKEQELISVIVPVYRAERFLPRCIESLIDQTYQNLEILLIDDGSPDKCGEICDAYAEKDARVRVLHQENCGVSETRNLGIRKAQGDLIYFLDSDDFFPSHALETLHRIMVTEDADIVIGGHSRVEPDGYIHCDSDGWPETADSDAIKEMILENRLPNFVCAKLSRRRIWKGIIFPKGQVMEDMYVSADLFYQARRVAMTKESLYFYSRENPSSIMSDGGNRYIRLKYGQFLAWREHERIADKMQAKCRAKCAEKALHGAVRAVMLNAGTGELTKEEVREAESYICQAKQVRGAGMKIARYLIRHHFRGLLSVAGGLQRTLVDRQQKKRQKRSLHK